jgi:hypothetical protein
MRGMVSDGVVGFGGREDADECGTGTTLVRLGYGDRVMDLVDPRVYDGECPEKNDPLPGRGAF